MAEAQERGRVGHDLRGDSGSSGCHAPTPKPRDLMEQLATPGSIRLTAATLRLVEGLVQVNALGPIPVKGLTEPVEVFELVGASAVRQRLQAAVERGLTHFVGRQTEIAALGQALERAGAGHGQIVAAVGEAGVGKSRLMYEFIHSHRTQGWLGVGGRLGVVRQSHPLLPGPRPAQALLSPRRAR